MNAPLALPIDGADYRVGDRVGELLQPPLKTNGNSESEAKFAGLCEARALRVIDGTLTLHEAVDELQGYTKLSGLIGAIGQDEVQDIMGRAFMVAEMLPDELHEACEREIMLGAADLVRGWEMNDPRDRWRHTGEAPPPPDNRVLETPLTYRTAQSTIDAFFFVVRTKSAEDIAEWLARHPRDEQHLYKLWKQKCSTK